MVLWSASGRTKYYSRISSHYKLFFFFFFDDSVQISKRSDDGQRTAFDLSGKFALGLNPLSLWTWARALSVLPICRLGNGGKYCKQITAFLFISCRSDMGTQRLWSTLLAPYTTPPSSPYFHPTLFGGSRWCVEIAAFVGLSELIWDSW